MGTVRIIIFLSWIFLFIWLFFHLSGLDGNEYFPDSLEIQPLLTDKYLDLGTVDPKGLGVDLLGCTTLGFQSWLIENATPYNCSVYSLYRCSCGPVEWHFCTFYSTCPLCSLSTSVCICLCLHLCITIIYLSILLEVSVSVLLSVLFSFNFSFDSSFLLEALKFPYLFPISWILLSTPSSLSTWRKIHCWIYSFICDKQCDHSQLSNLLYFKLLPCKRE